LRPALIDSISSRIET